MWSLCRSLVVLWVRAQDQDVGGDGSMDLHVFCFKQKTADGMRISDWSSDVCSSDLRSSKAASSPMARCMYPIAGRTMERSGKHVAKWSTIAICNGPHLTRSETDKWGGGAPNNGSRSKFPKGSCRSIADRKDVVWGKGVSVRVDIGVGLIIKKKNK